jgi:hypothetical protein
MVENKELILSEKDTFLTGKVSCENRTLRRSEILIEKNIQNSCKYPKERPLRSQVTEVAQAAKCKEQKSGSLKLIPLNILASSLH